MARSKITNTTDDLIVDSGAVLWSFVKGEQLEYPITLNFIDNAAAGYTFEAVVVEAQYEAGQTDKPTAVKADGVQTVLNVRVPTQRGTWQTTQAYNTEEVVLHNGTYYKLLYGSNYVNSVAPDLDSRWAITTTNVVYVQFPSALGSDYQVQPSVAGASYGFFELRVTEPQNPIFVRTWKPIRGMVEIQFSPTDIVPG